MIHGRSRSRHLLAICCVGAVMSLSCRSAPATDITVGSTSVPGRAAPAAGTALTSAPTTAIDASPESDRVPTGGDGAPRNPFLADSPWPSSHAGPARQASTPIAGPTSDDVSIEIVDYRDDIGFERNASVTGAPVNLTSPWLMLSDRRYADAPDARAMWATSLTDVFKYAVYDDGRTRYVDHRQLRNDPFSVGWNMVPLADGRLIVPSPLGSRTVDRPCRTLGPALLEFTDGPSIDSPLTCTAHLRATPDVFASCRGPDDEPIGEVESGYSMSLTNVTFSGELIVGLRVQNRAGTPLETYIAAVENDLSGFVDCAFLAAGDVTNAPAMEPLADGGTSMFLATDESIVSMHWDPVGRLLERQWERAVPLRFRTGTTPTMVGFDDDRFLALVDAPCAVVDVFTGQIECSPDSSPAQLIALRRDRVPTGGADDLLFTPLPDAIRTVENSPSASGLRLVVANYGGYEPDPTSRGVVGLVWSDADDAFVVDWFNPDIQMNGVTTISDGAGLVYGNGVADDGSVHFSGLHVADDPATGRRGGEVALDVQVVGAAAVESAFDQGNGSTVNDDGSVIWATQRGFVRVRPDIRPYDVSSWATVTDVARRVRS